ncbi:hypothetical protein RA307_03130 [Xanthobacteraceae bacterium Astr-EGSB]|uniref:hypothetical protein n=1 Tax=Astrobacterium formosum TaxID=3069710 RepID=UPI0027B6F18A|nr:hypothetical protein [Xanthobacteraceae bacterium Astr-EGSB]
MNSGPREKPSYSALSKAERERDQASAMREYQAERVNIQARTAKLREQRLAKEAAERNAAAAAAPAPKPARRRKSVKS